MHLYENVVYRPNCSCTLAIWGTLGENGDNIKGGLWMLIFEPLTMVAQDEEAAATEVTVELDEDLVRSAVHRLQSCVPTELPNLW